MNQSNLLILSGALFVALMNSACSSTSDNTQEATPETDTPFTGCPSFIANYVEEGSRIDVKNIAVIRKTSSELNAATNGTYSSGCPPANPEII